MRRIIFLLIPVVLFHSCSSYKIQKIEFRTSGCFGTCPSFEIRIDSNRNATYIASSYNQDNDGKDISGTFATRIDEKHYDEIVESLNDIDFVYLRDKYEVGVTDQATATLKITYDNDQTKVIEDYGERGTFGLKRLYELLFALRLNQNWH